MKGDKHGRLFHLDLNQKKSPPFCLIVTSSSSTSHEKNTWDLWHRRLGHPHASRLESMFKSKVLPDKLIVKNNDFQHCQTCVLGKFAKLPFTSSTTKVDASFDLIHCDLWGPSPILSKLGYKYFVLFIDHFTRFTWVYFLHAKSELENIAKNFVTMIETQFGKVIKKF